MAAEVAFACNALAEDVLEPPERLLAADAVVVVEGAGVLAGAAVFLPPQLASTAPAPNKAIKPMKSKGRTRMLGHARRRRLNAE